ncbi:tellurite resistance TerB family protein [Synechococcus sp. UW140]|uniref:tellurite resistance TerB family protein n=1 Tax=Synechococcus sp. UW140 TaxID=368503 RepID=UPI0025E93957|nr:tellurite resistance TerB family protein [Synechococcus sp. UW140]
MNSAESFAAVCLAAVASDGVLGRDEARSLRIELEFRTPFSSMEDREMTELFDRLLALWRDLGTMGLVKSAIPQLTPAQRETALAVATQLVRADRVVEAEELEFLNTLASSLDLNPGKAELIIEVMDILHRDALDTSN